MLNRRLELSAVRKGGEVFPVEVAIAPISSEGSAMFAGYMRDITERRQAEAALAERMSLASLTAAVGLALTRGTDSRAMLQQCAEALVKHLDGGLARIWTLNEQEPMLELQASAGTHTGLDGALAARAGRRLHDRRDRRRTTPAARHRRQRRSADRGSGLGPARTDGRVCRLSAAARRQAGRRDGDLRAPQVFAVGARGDGGGRRRHRPRHRTQACRAGAGALHAGSRAGAQDGAAKRGAAGQAGRSAARDPGTGGSGDPRQERFPRQHESRAAHAAERDHSLQRAAAGRGRRSGPPGIDRRPAEDSVRRQAPARADQRHPRPVEDRSRQDDALAGALRRSGR